MTNGLEVDSPDENWLNSIPDAQEKETATTENEACEECGLAGAVVFLTCDGPEKKHYFCWRCDGYSSAPLDKVANPGAQGYTPTYVFCREHLEELEATVRGLFEAS